MKSKPGKRGNPRMVQTKRKKLEVWLSEGDFAALKTVADAQGWKLAQLVRILIRYVGKGGPTAALILEGVWRDRGGL